MRRSGLIALTAALAILPSPEPTYAQTRSRVALEWHQVSDAHVARCGLSRLRAGTLERLVDDGYAVVERVDVVAGGIQVRVSSVEGGLRLVVSASGTRLEDTLKFPEDCDATFLLEAIARVEQLVRDAEAAAASRSDSEHSRDEIARVETTEPTLRVSLDATAKAAHPQKFLLLGGGLGGALGLSEDWEIGGRIELTGRARLNVTLLEGMTAVSAAWRVAPSSLSLYLEAGPLLHIGSSEERTVREMDAILAVGPRLSAGHFLAHVLAYARLRRLEHRIDEQVAFDTRHFGLVLRLGAQLFDS